LRVQIVLLLRHPGASRFYRRDEGVVLDAHCVGDLVLGQTRRQTAILEPAPDDPVTGLLNELDLLSHGALQTGRATPVGGEHPENDLPYEGARSVTLYDTLWVDMI